MDLAALAGLDAVLQRHLPGPDPFLRLGFSDEDVAAAWYDGFHPSFRWLLDLPGWPPSVVEVEPWVNQVVAALRAVDRSRTPATPPEATAAWGAFISTCHWALDRGDLRDWGPLAVRGYDTEQVASGFKVRLAPYNPGWLGPLRVLAAERAGTQIPAEATVAVPGPADAASGRENPIDPDLVRSLIRTSGTNIWVGENHYTADEKAVRYLGAVRDAFPERIIQKEIRKKYPDLTKKMADYHKQLPEPLRDLIDRSTRGHSPSASRARGSDLRRLAVKVLFVTVFGSAVYDDLAYSC